MTDEHRDADDQTPEETTDGDAREEFDLNAPSGQSAADRGDEFDLNTLPSERAARAAEPRRLRRSAQERMITGVAGGLADYFEIDPVLVRLAFVLGAIFGAGLGLLIYIVAWVVMPGPRGDTAPQRDRRPRSRRRGLGGLVFGLVLIVVGGVALLASTDAVDPSGRWILVGLAALLVLVGSVILVRSRLGLDGGLVFWGVVVTAVLVISLQVNLTFESGFSQRDVSPDSVEELESSYSHAFGSLHLDLRELELPPGTTELSLDIAFGELIVNLPRDVGWRVAADVMFGNTEVPGREFSGVSDGVETSSNWDTAERRIDLDISTAFGSAEVRQ